MLKNFELVLKLAYEFKSFFRTTCQQSWDTRCWSSSVRGRGTQRQLGVEPGKSPWPAVRGARAEVIAAVVTEVVEEALLHIGGFGIGVDVAQGIQGVAFIGDGAAGAVVALCPKVARARLSPHPREDAARGRAG